MLQLLHPRLDPQNAADQGLWSQNKHFFVYSVTQTDTQFQFDWNWLKLYHGKKLNLLVYVKMKTLNYKSVTWKLNLWKFYSGTHAHNKIMHQSELRVQNFSVQLTRASRSARDLVAQFGRRHDFSQKNTQQIKLLSGASVRLVLPEKII